MRARVKAVLVGLNFGQWVLDHEVGPDSPWIDLVGVCDLDADKARRAATARGVAVYTDLAAVCADPAVEAVLLITGPQGRARLVETLVRAGKHVMTTKPFDPSPEEAFRVLTLARQRGLVVHMNAPAPSLPPDLAQIQAWRSELGLGRVVSFRASTYCSYRESADGSWYDDPDQCPAAPLYRLGIYLFHDLVRLVSPVEQLRLLQTRLFTGRPTADSAAVLLQCRDGEIGTVSSSFAVDDGQAYRCALEVNYERGTVYRNQGPRPEGDRSVTLSVTARVGGHQTIHEATVPSTDGYPWEFFWNRIRGVAPADDLSPEQVSEALRLVEGLRRGQLP